MNKDKEQFWESMVSPEIGCGTCKHLEPDGAKSCGRVLLQDEDECIVVSRMVSDSHPKSIYPHWEWDGVNTEDNDR